MTASSSRQTNVYADLGHEDAETMLVKAAAARDILHAVAAANLSMEEASARAGMTSDALAAILDGQFSDISVEALQAIAAAVLDATGDSLRFG